MIPARTFLNFCGGTGAPLRDLAAVGGVVGAAGAVTGAGVRRHRGRAAWTTWPVGAWLGTARARDRVEQFLSAAQPLRRWLEVHVR